MSRTQINGEREWNEQRIADALGVSQATISGDLGNLSTPDKLKPAKSKTNPKGAGRPKGGAKKPRKACDITSHRQIKVMKNLEKLFPIESGRIPSSSLPSVQSLNGKAPLFGGVKLIQAELITGVFYSLR